MINKDGSTEINDSKLEISNFSHSLNKLYLYACDGSLLGILNSSSSNSTRKIATYDKTFGETKELMKVYKNVYVLTDFLIKPNEGSTTQTFTLDVEINESAKGYKLILCGPDCDLPLREIYTGGGNLISNAFGIGGYISRDFEKEEFADYYFGFDNFYAEEFRVNDKTYTVDSSINECWGGKIQILNILIIHYLFLIRF